MDVDNASLPMAVQTETPDTHTHQPPSEALSVRRVISETETLVDCTCGCSDQKWKVTSRTVQVGQSYEEAAARAYIATLHSHLRKAAATVQQASSMLMAAGKTKEAHGMQKAAQAILATVEGQD